MLILEGPDLVGKTTLAKKLVAAAHKAFMPASYTHFSRLPDCWKFPSSYRHYITCYGVCDRFHMSEIAYSEARGDARKLNVEGYRLIDTWCRLQGSVTVLIRAKPGVISARYAAKSNSRDEMYKDSVIERANDTYRAIAERSYRGRDNELLVADVDFDWVAADAGAYPAEDEPFIRSIIDLWYKRVATVAGLAHDSV